MPEIIIFKNSTDLLSNSLSADILFFAYPERPRKCTKRLLHIFDTIISLFVISPLVIAHWRGTWNIVSSEYYKPTYCFIIGSGLHVAFTLLREILHAEFVVPEPGTKKCWKRKLRRFFITKAYTYCFSVGCIMQWRGGWDAFEEYFGKTLTPALLTSIILLIPLMGFRGLRNFFHGILLQLIDICFVTFVLSTTVVTYWRGTWNLVTHYLYPDDPTSSAIASLLIGINGHLIFTGFQRVFKNSLNPDKHRLTYYIGSRIYTYLYGFVCVNGWRGGWQLLDLYTPHVTWHVLATVIVSVLALSLLKSLRNISAAPFVCVNDDQTEYFDVPTLFRKGGSRDPGLYVLDCLFSVLVIGTLVVFVWRGLWVFLDLELFPNNPIYSSWGSVLIGYSVVAVTFALQPVMKWTCDRLDGWRRVAAADIFLFFSFIGTINVWRGVWHVLDNYFLTDDKLLGDWITHGVSMILLILLNCSNSVLVRGVYIDAEEPAGQCVIFPVYYIRLFFQKERTKKQKRLLETLERQEQNNINLLEKPHNNNFNAKIVKSNNNRIINTNTHDRKSISLEQQELLTKITVEVDGNENIENQKNNEVKALSKENFPKE
uniref:CSON012613 protein n=1 Tax=Culicoides sonorensis TaxID=179676 RepID=A0A336M8G3_CULSO